MSTATLTCWELHGSSELLQVLELRLKRMDLRLRARKAFSLPQLLSSSWMMVTMVYTSKNFLFVLREKCGYYIYMSDIIIMIMGSSAPNPRRP